MSPTLHLLTPVDGALYDALWELELPLSAAERDLLAQPTLTRLHHVRHAGAASLTTAQTYSRLEHTVGVFALACHFAPDDAALRAAALLHDVGHLPLSHTLEGIDGLDHHAVGVAQRSAPGVRAALAGLDHAAVERIASGETASLLRPGRGRLGLDHLDSFVRAGRVHGWLDRPPHELLAALRVRSGALEAPGGAGDALAALMYANAAFHSHPANVGPTAMLRRSFRRLVAAGVDRAGLDRATDEQLWRLLLSAEASRADAQRLLDAPGELACRVLAADEPAPPPLEPLELPPPYVYRPASEPSPAADALLARVAELPTRFAVGWREELA